MSLITYYVRAWLTLVSAYFGLGVLSLTEQQYETAEANFMEAQNYLLRGGQARSDPLIAGCLYKIGCCTLNQGKGEAAM